MRCGVPVHLLFDLLSAPNEQVYRVKFMTLRLILVDLLLNLQALLEVAKRKPYLKALLQGNFAKSDKSVGDGH